MVELKDFHSDYENKWCPGCGNFNILDAMKQAFVSLGIEPDQLLVVSGIGQAGKTPHFFQCNMFHGLHGRAIPVATGAKIANHDLNIFVTCGDGDCYGEGGNHFFAAIRRNIDITVIVHNNQIYGLTKGQASPTSSQGMVTKLQNQGVTSTPFNPLATAIASGAGFVARGFSGDTDQLTGLIKEAMNYRGFSLLDILQPCVSFNKLNTSKWYKDRVYPVNETGHDPSDISQAILLSQDWEDRIATGILFKKQGVPFQDRIFPGGRPSLISQKMSIAERSELLFKTL